LVMEKKPSPEDPTTGAAEHLEREVHKKREGDRCRLYVKRETRKTCQKAGGGAKMTHKKNPSKTDVREEARWTVAKGGGKHSTTKIGLKKKDSNSHGRMWGEKTGYGRGIGRGQI